MTRLRRPSVALLLAAALLGAPAAPALAHDELIGSDPRDGATVEAPEDLVLTFSGRIGDLGAQVAVTGPDGRPVVDGEPRVDGVEVTQDLLADLEAGDHDVVWRVTSEDGHPIAGELSFTVEDAEETEAPEETDVAAETTTSEADGADATADATVDAEASGAADGLPAWVWVLAVLAVGGVLALLSRTWSRGRP